MRAAQAGDADDRQAEREAETMETTPLVDRAADSRPIHNEFWSNGRPLQPHAARIIRETRFRDILSASDIRHDACANTGLKRYLVACDADPRTIPIITNTQRTHYHQLIIWTE
jgi:hypothetical protein